MSEEVDLAISPGTLDLKDNTTGEEIAQYMLKETVQAFNGDWDIPHCCWLVDEAGNGVMVAGIRSMEDIASLISSGLERLWQAYREIMLPEVHQGGTQPVTADKPKYFIIYYEAWQYPQERPGSFEELETIGDAMNETRCVVCMTSEELAHLSEQRYGGTHLEAIPKGDTSREGTVLWEAYQHATEVLS